LTPSTSSRPRPRTTSPRKRPNYSTTSCINWSWPIWQKSRRPPQNPRPKSGSGSKGAPIPALPDGKKATPKVLAPG